MHATSAAAARQRRVQKHIDNVDAYGFFNLLTAPEQLDDAESLLPEHGERLFAPTETVSMFMAQALLADGTCRQAVDDAPVKRLIAGLPRCSSNTAAYCKARAAAADDGLHLGLAHRSTRRRRAQRWLVVARPAGAVGRWNHSDLGRHRGESGRLSAVGQPMRGLRLSEDAPGRSVVPRQRRAARCGRGSVQGQR